MAQPEVSPTIKIKAENVLPYAQAIANVTGQEVPSGEITNPQMNLLIRALMNRAVRQYRLSIYEPPIPE
jgi:hypothetical protein